MGGAEIAAALWPFVKVGGMLVAGFGLVWMLFRRIRKGAAAEAERDMLKGAEDDRIDFEKDRAAERNSALARWRRRRDELRGASSERGDDS